MGDCKYFVILDFTLGDYIVKSCLPNSINLFITLVTYQYFGLLLRRIRFLNVHYNNVISKQQTWEKVTTEYFTKSFKFMKNVSVVKLSSLQKQIVVDGIRKGDSKEYS